MLLHSLRSRAGFFTFVSLLACLTSSTVICFSMAILNDSLVYAGIACLIAVVILIITYVGCRFCCLGNGNTTSSCVHRSRDSDDVIEGGQEGQSVYRRLEREIEDLFAEVSELQVTALTTPEVLDRENENIRREYVQLTQWIEGVKTPEREEIVELTQRLDSIRSNLLTFRRRSERITSWLAMCPLPSVAPNSQLPRPPAYEESGRPGQTNLYSIEQCNVTLPSYTAESRVFLAPPSDDHEAPPPYDEAVGTPV